jgi:signal transduction histidine kinase
MLKQRTAAWVAWTLGAIAVAAILAGIVLKLAAPSGSLPASISTSTFDMLDEFSNILVPLIGALVASRRPDINLGWLFLVAGLGLGLSNFGQVYAAYALVVYPGSLPAPYFMGWLSNWSWTLAIGAVPVLFLLFPTGEVHSRRWRPVLWVALAAYAALFAVAMVSATYSWSKPLAVEGGWAAPDWLEPVLTGVFYAIAGLAPVALASTFLRYRQSGPEERQQLKWVAVGATFFVGLVVASAFTESVVIAILFPLASIALFGSIGVAILMYRLYDIDLVINKGVVFGALAAFFTAVYVAVVVGIGALVGSRANTLLTVIAAVLIAVAFHPVREWARHLANSLVYGKRATPYEVLSEFSDRVTSAFATEDLPSRMAGILGEGTGATRAVVWIRVGAELQPAASWPVDAEPLQPLPGRGEDLPGLPGAAAFIPVRHQGELLGALSIDKPPNEPLTPAEEKLVTDLASQAGLVLRNVSLIEELRASRQRLVRAQDEERRRLERNIHDGAQQQLVALSVKMTIVRAMFRKDVERADEMLQELQAETQDAMENLRDLARGIYPPLLADHGLVAALEAQGRKAAVPIRIESDGITRYAQDAEAAVYFCALEALQNVAKYAGATGAEIRLREDDGALVFEVADDGAGFDPEAQGYGTGLQGMADRLAALGGTFAVTSSPGQGTVVRGAVPVTSRAQERISVGSS